MHPAFASSGCWSLSSICCLRLVFVCVCRGAVCAVFAVCVEGSGMLLLSWFSLGWAEGEAQSHVLWSEHSVSCDSNKRLLQACCGFLSSAGLVLLLLRLGIVNLVQDYAPKQRRVRNLNHQTGNGGNQDESGEQLRESDVWSEGAWMWAQYQTVQLDFDLLFWFAPTQEGAACWLRSVASSGAPGKGDPQAMGGSVWRCVSAGVGGFLCRLLIVAYIVLMKAVVLLVCLLGLCAGLPYVEQMLLANSMIVGRDDGLDLLNWECNVCAPENKPLHAHFIENKEKDIKCVLGVYPTFVVLAFRYTNTLLNVWQDILYANQVVDTNVCANCKIQKAYKKMWETITNDVLADLRLIRQQTGLKRIYITGISLGGGLSVISEIDVKNANIFDTVQVINFGSPRVANKYYADFHDAATKNSTVRFIVKGDPIVVLPECLTPLCNYKHVGRQYVCIEDEQICRGNQPVPEGPFARLAWKLHADPSQKNLGSIVDHIYGYRKIYNSTMVEN